MKKLLTLAALGVAAMAGVAIAQTIGIAQAPLVHSTTDLIQIVPNGQPSSQSFYVPPAALSSQEQYSKVTLTGQPASAYTQTFANFQTDLLLLASGTIAFAYINFAPNPSDGARECVYANQIVTLAYPTANTGQTVNSSNTITTMAASTRYCFLYSASNLTWDRDGS